MHNDCGRESNMQCVIHNCTFINTQSRSSCTNNLCCLSIILIIFSSHCYFREGQGKFSRVKAPTIAFRDEDPLEILKRLLPELNPVLFWMSIALEMLHFLQCNLSNYLLPKEQIATTKEALTSADDELLTVLEEVIMFTFQQTVYHMTKVRN